MNIPSPVSTGGSLRETNRTRSGEFATVIMGRRETHDADDSSRENRQGQRLSRRPVRYATKENAKRPPTAASSGTGAARLVRTYQASPASNKEEKSAECPPLSR